MKTVYLCAFTGPSLATLYAAPADISALQAKLNAVAAGAPDEWFTVPATATAPEKRVRLSAIGMLQIQ